MKYLRHYNSLTQRLFIIVLLNLVAMVGLALYSANALFKAESLANRSYQQLAVPSMNLTGNYINVLVRHIQYTEALFKTGEAQQKLLDYAQVFSGKADEKFQALQASDISPRVQPLIDEYAAALQRFNSHEPKLRELTLSGEQQQAFDYIENTIRPDGIAMAKTVEKAFQALADTAETFNDEGQALQVTAVYVMLAITLVGVVLSLFLSLRGLKAMNRSLGSARRLANNIADGRLYVDAQTDGPAEVREVLQALSRMVHQLKSVAMNVSGAVDEVSDATRDMANGNRELSERTRTQAGHLESTANAMEEMTATIKQNAQYAERARELAMGSSSQAQQGSQVVANAIHAMEEINESSHRIGDIVTLIDGIAFQTNLLALNAAVEAARAGEKGRGFAVVAAEVRNLAQKSAEAAAEIKALIADSMGKVQSGTELVNRSGDVLDAITNRIGEVSEIIERMASAGQQQASGIDAVSVSLNSMDSMTQANAQMVEDAAVASQQLESLAERLHSHVAFFRVSESGHRSLPTRSGTSKDRSAAVAGDSLLWAR